MNHRRDIVVVGASAAGLGVAESLRHLGYEGAITLVGAEAELPYNRPPLSKQVLSGAWEPSKTTLRPQEHLDQLDVRLRLGTAATGLDVRARRVRLDGGESLSYDGLVVATGVAPRKLPFGHDLDGVHVLRTLGDAAALRADLLRGGPLVVVGAGPLGCEAAATARKMGLDVTLVDVLSEPMVRQVGREVGLRLAELHAAHDVGLRLGTGVSAIHADLGTVAAVELLDGTRLDAAVVLVAVGSLPAVSWLESSGVPLGNGVICDARCQAADDVFAAGDVAEWFNPRFGRRMRVEHRMNATEQAQVVAANLLGAEQEFAPVPYFWSDQYDVKLQAHGLLEAEDEVVFDHADHPEGRFAVLYGAGGIVQGVLGWGIPREIRRYRDAVGEPLAARSGS